jgi:hypothetical protein
MGATPYKAISFANHDVLTKDKMDQLQFNAQWLYENTPRARFNDTSTGRIIDTGIIILSGRVYVPRSQHLNAGTVNVTFGGVGFSTTTKVSVQTSVISDQSKQIFVTLKGFGTSVPDYRGFTATINVLDTPKVTARPIYLMWKAVGPRQ